MVPAYEIGQFSLELLNYERNAFAMSSRVLCFVKIHNQTTVMDNVLMISLQMSFALKLSLPITRFPSHRFNLAACDVINSDKDILDKT